MLLRQIIQSLAIITWIAGSHYTTALGAELKYLGTDKNIYTPYGYQPDTHVFSLSGTIGGGDSNTLRSALARLLDTTAVFCEVEKPAVIYLNSNGGSFAGGLKLAALFREMGIGTIVKSGSKCLSACAVSFLGGTRHLCLDGDTASYRRLEPGAKLGFHAPKLLVPEKGYDQVEIVGAYDAAVKQIGGLVDEIKKAGIKSSLVIEMLKVGVSDLYYIDTVGKAGRWGFDVVVAGIDRPRRDQLITACANADAWTNDSFFPTADFENSPEEMTPDLLERLYIEGRLGQTRRAFVQATGMYPKSCFIELGTWPNTGRNRHWAKFFDESIQDVQQMYKMRSLEAAGVVFTPLHYYKYDVKLVDLPSAK